MLTLRDDGVIGVGVGPHDLVVAGAAHVAQLDVVGACALDGERNGDRVVLAHGVDELAQARAVAILDRHGPVVVTRGVVMQHAELELDGRGGANDAREREWLILGVGLADLETRLCSLEGLHGLEDGIGGRIVLGYHGVCGDKRLVEDSDALGRVLSGVGRRLGVLDGLLELLKGVVGLAVDDGHRHVVVGADHEALGGDRSHGHVELAVADGAGAHDALGADLDGLVCLALVEDYVFGIGVEVALNGGAGLKVHDHLGAAGGAATARDAELVNGILVHGDLGHVEVDHARAVVVQIGGGVDANGSLVTAHDLDFDGVGARLEGVGGEERDARGALAGTGVDLDRLFAVDRDLGVAMVGVDRAHEHELGAIELEGRGCAGLAGPHAGAVDEAGVFLLVPPAAGLHLGVVEDFHALGDGHGLLEGFGGLEDADPGDLGDLAVKGAEVDLDGAGGHVRAAHEALGAHGAALAVLHPLAAGVAVRDGEVLDVLAVLDGLLKGDHVEGALLGKLDEERLGARGVLGAPVGLVLAVEHLAGAVRGVVLPGAAGLGGRRRTSLALAREVLGEGLLNVVAKIERALLDLGVDRARIVGRHVEQQRGAVTDRVEVHVAELGEGLGSLHVVVPEPAGGDAGVRLGHDPLASCWGANADLRAHRGVVLDVLVPGDLGGARIPVGVHLDAVPGGVSGKAVLVAHPTDLGLQAALEEDALVALELLDGFGKALEVVVLCVGAGALCAVHPHLDKLAFVAVLGIAEDLAQLPVVEVVVVVGLSVLVAVARLMDIPGGEVQAHVEVICGARLGKLRQDVDPARGAAHVVVGRLAVPDAEAVMVLGGDDQALEAGLLDHLDVALGIEGLEVVHIGDRRGHLGAVVGAPLDAREGVGPKVAERRELLLGVFVLTLVGDDVVLLGLCGGNAVEALIGDPLIREHRRGQCER